MKTIIQKVLIAGLCMTAPAFIYADDQSSTSQSGDTSTQGSEHQHGMMHGMGMHQISNQNPTDANRASKLIGMDVVNSQNRKLGTVRDLIVDPKSQRVAYAWVEKSDEAGNTGKYVAVPLSIFSPSSDQKNLVVNADKRRFDSAQGYAKNQMPNMALPSSQLSFWQSISEASGAPSGQSQGGSDQQQQQQGGQQQQ